MSSILMFFFFSFIALHLFVLYQLEHFNGFIDVCIELFVDINNVYFFNFFVVVMDDFCLTEIDSFRKKFQKSMESHFRGNNTNNSNRWGNESIFYSLESNYRTRNLR